jgi:hypothetical protein
MSDSNSSGGVGFFGLMFLIFMTLKLTNVIDWSWWWVTAPLWGGVALLLAFIAVIVVIPLLFVFLGSCCVWVLSLFERKPRRPWDK